MPESRKLTLSDAINIRVRIRRGEKAADLAREFGVTRGNITAITQRRYHRLPDRMKAK